METYDILMLVVLFGAMVFGAVKGFAWQLASLASIVISYIVAYRFREPFSESIQAEPPWNRFLAMLILFLGTSLIIWMVFRMIRGNIDRLKLREFDRQVGAMFGLAKGAIYCTLITLFAVTLSGDATREKIVVSKSGRYIAQVLDRSESVIPPEIHDVVGPYLERFNREFNEPPGDRFRVPGERLREAMPWANGDQFTDSAASGGNPIWGGGTNNPPLPTGSSDWLPAPIQQAQQQFQQARGDLQQTSSTDWVPAPIQQAQQQFQQARNGLQQAQESVRQTQQQFQGQWPTRQARQPTWNGTQR